MIEIYYNHTSSLGPGWVSGSKRFKSNDEIVDWIKSFLDVGKEILITAYVKV